VAYLLSCARDILTSNLTWIECDRVLCRYAALEGRPLQEIEDCRQRMRLASMAWISVEMTAECQARARGSFPIEPVRTLDALHLATAIVAREWIADLQVVSLDKRVRENAQALGFAILP